MLALRPSLNIAENNDLVLRKRARAALASMAGDRLHRPDEKIKAATKQLMADRFLLAQDLPDVIDRAMAAFDWFTRR